MRGAGAFHDAQLGVRALLIHPCRVIDQDDLTRRQLTDVFVFPVIARCEAVDDKRSVPEIVYAVAPVDTG
jgi:hypothetical protein